jgi:hypothetical protein
MRTPAILGLVLALTLMVPRTAEACDPNCATLERLAGTVIVALPMTLLTSLIAPAIGRSTTEGRRGAPSYGKGLGYSLLGASAGAVAAVASHAVLFPDSKYGLSGSPMGLTGSLAFFSIPPVVGGGVASYLVYQDDSPAPEPGVSLMIAPSSKGLSLSLGGRF